MLSKFLVYIGGYFFSYDELHGAYKKLRPTNNGRLNIKSRILHSILKFINTFYNVEKLKEHYLNNSKVKFAFSKDVLNFETHNIFNMPKLILSNDEPKRVNVLVPAFTMSTISAGFFGVFAFAKLIATLGYKTRLVLFEDFSYDEEALKTALKKYPGIDDLFDILEVEYVGGHPNSLKISPNDMAVATVWYSAYFAENIRKACDCKYFLYLVQDYEAAFHPHNSSYILARNSYDFPNRPWFSTEPLKDFFVKAGIYHGEAWQDYCVYNNTCSPASDVQRSLAIKESSNERNFVFYCRPQVHRNVFHLGALAIVKAFQDGVFNQTKKKWNFYGIGIGDVEIYLDDHNKLKQLPRMSLEDYQKMIKMFDVGLSLMASPHPSITPFDLAASGSIVVTNSYLTKTPQYFANISRNILCAQPELDSLVKHIEIAVQKAENFEARLAGSEVKFSTTWEQCWTAQHRQFLNNLIEGAYHKDTQLCH